MSGRSERRACVIRQELPSDQREVLAVVRECFAPQGSARPPEVQLVKALHRMPEFDRRLSFVAEVAGVVAGYLLFSPMVIETASGERPALALAPLAVRRGFECFRVGTRLMRTGLATCAALGHSRVLVLGHPKYYCRFGFRPARSQYGIEPPEPWPDGAFQALAFSPEALTGVSGRARYPRPFVEMAV